MQWVKAPTTWIISASLVVVIVLLISYERFSSNKLIDKPSYPVQRTVKYSFTVKNPNSDPVQSAQLQVIAPIEIGPFQKSVSLNASQSFDIRSNDLGTKRMMFDIENLPPYGSRNISVVASVDLSEQGQPIDSVRSEDFLNDEKLVQLTDPGIQRIAQRLRSEDARETIKKTYDWIVANVRNTGYVRDDLGAVQALKSKSGDCTEFMYLFAALARANGIPTRNIAGFVAKENRILRPADYHNWNEVYLDGSWHIVDTDRQVLMEKSSEYLAMRLISENRPGLSENSQNFFSSSQNIQVTMN